jgi:hypothetical protein
MQQGTKLCRWTRKFESGSFGKAESVCRENYIAASRPTRLGERAGRPSYEGIVKTAVIQLEGHLTDIPGNAQRQGGSEVGIDNRRRRVSIGGARNGTINQVR